MKKCTLLFFVIIFLSPVSTINSDDLGDFKDQVEQEEEENRQDDEESGDSESDDKKERQHPFLRFLWEITFYLWYIHNDSVYYTPYPYEADSYSEGHNFIAIDSGTEEEIKALNRTRKNYHFALYGGGTANDELSTFGATARFTGKFFNHMGPEIEYRLMYDGSDLLHFLTAGANLSFFQMDYLSLDFYLEGAFFMGILERSGISLGAALHTYPVKPLSLEIRGGAVIFPSISFGEIYVKAGFHPGRFEIYTDFHTLQSQSSALYSFGLGAGVHF